MPYLHGPSTLTPSVILRIGPVITCDPELNPKIFFAMRWNATKTTPEIAMPPAGQIDIEQTD